MSGTAKRSCRALHETGAREHPSEHLSQTFFDIMDQQHMEKIFVQFADKERNRILSGDVPKAFQALGIPADKVQPFDQDGGLDMDEFIRAVRLPSVLETWCTTLPLAKLLACCLQLVRGSAAESQDPIRDCVSKLVPKDIEKVVEYFHDGVRRLLGGKVSELERCYKELDEKAAKDSDGSIPKYTFEFSAGNADNFYAGLADQVGELSTLNVGGSVSPGIWLVCESLLVAAADLRASRGACTVGEPHPNLRQGMEEEHCTMYGNDVQFKKGNGVMTTPAKEYKIVIGEEKPEEDTKDKKSKIVRVIRRIEDLQNLPQSKEAGLILIEIIAIVSSVAFLVTASAFP